MLFTKKALLDSGLRNYLRRVHAGSVLYYPGLDNDVLTIKDFSGNNNHGSITGATWGFLPSGLPALNFDGDDLVTCPLVITSPMWQRSVDFTAYGWVKTTAFTAQNQVIMGLKQAVEDFTLGIICLQTITYDTQSKNRINIIVRDNTNQAFNRWSTDNNINLVNDTWYFWAVIQSGATVSFNINGVANTGVNALTGAINGASFNNASTLLGVRSSSNPEIYAGYLTGRMALTRVETNVLTTAQLLASFQQERHLIPV